MLGALLALTACGDSSVPSAPQAGHEPRIETFAGTGNSGLGAERVDPRKSELGGRKALPVNVLRPNC